MARILFFAPRLTLAFVLDQATSDHPETGRRGVTGDAMAVEASERYSSRSAASSRFASIAKQKK